MDEREQKVHDTFEQLKEGAITFKEFATYVYSLIREDEQSYPYGSIID